MKPSTREWIKKAESDWLLAVCNFGMRLDLLPRLF
jgi:hypothetical protein